MPRDPLPTYNAQGQRVSGSYPATFSMASTSCITTPGPVVYDISNIEIQDDICQVGHFYNPEFLSEIPSSWLRHYGIMIDTGASASVAPPSFADHIKLEKLDIASSMKLQTATAGPIHLHGFKDVHLIIGQIDSYARFYISDVSQPILGLNDIINSGATLNINDPLSSLSIKTGKEELLQYLHRRLWTEAIALPVDHDINAAWIFYIQHKHFADSNGLCLNDIEHAKDISIEHEHSGHPTIEELIAS